MSEREQFEAWAKARYAKNPHFWLRQIDDGGYSCGMADSAWDAWQARAQPAQAVPLTDAEIDASSGTPDPTSDYGCGYYAGARWAEARLRGIVGKEGA